MPMTIDEFMTAPLSSLESLTGVDRSNWSKYFNGSLLSEATLNKASFYLGMSPDQLLKAINLRREALKNVLVSCEK